jgi:hypothetical protein
MHVPYAAGVVLMLFGAVQSLIPSCENTCEHIYTANATFVESCTNGCNFVELFQELVNTTLCDGDDAYVTGCLHAVACRNCSTFCVRGTVTTATQCLPLQTIRGKEMHIVYSIRLH